jgi:hypothetical protein
LAWGQLCCLQSNDQFDPLPTFPYTWIISRGCMSRFD